MYKFRSKCVHVLPCIYKLRAKEAQEIQLYQIKEKQARKMAEIEFNKMWHEVAMRESDALVKTISFVLYLKMMTIPT